MTHPPLIIQTEHLSALAHDWLAQRARLIACSSDDEAFVQHLADAEALVVRTYTIVDDALLARARRLKVVGRAGVGLDNVNVEACRRRGVEVVYTPDANTQAVVEYVLRLVLTRLRPLARVESAVTGPRWRELREVTVGQRELAALTVGILGLGRIGSRLARVLGALGCRIIYADVREIPAQERSGAEPVSAETLFGESDLITVHIDGRASNRGFVNAALLEGMKREVIFVNTSRGFVVDAPAVAEAMRGRPSATALLDVHEPEPIESASPLLGMPNVELYPHLASRTQAAMERMSWVVRDVWAVVQGRMPDFPAPLES